MDNKELGDKYIRLGRLLKNDKAKIRDLVAAAMDCGLIFTFDLQPNPADSVDLTLGMNEEPQTICEQR